MPRTTAATRTLTAETGTTRRRTAAPASGTARTGGVSRPTLANTPGREKVSSSGPRAGVGTGGWAAYRKVKSERSEKYPRFEVDKTGRKIFRFAEAEPFAFIYRHWVAKRPYTCLGDDCPLCEAGHKPKPVVFYNVITVADGILRVWEMSSEPVRKVQKRYDTLAAKDKTLADDDLYFVISKEKKDNGFFEYEVEQVRARDLSDEGYGEPLSAEDMAAALKRGLFTDEVVYVANRSDLVDAVEKLDDED